MHQVIVGFGDFAFCQFTIDPRGIDVFGRFSGLTSQQVSNDDMTGSFHQTAGMEILVTAALLLESFDTGDHLLEPHAQVGQFALHGAHFGGIVRSLVGLDLLQERTFGHGIDRRNDLQLRSTLVDIHDTGITVEAFAGIVLHEARTAVNLYRIVSELVGILRSEELYQRRETVGQTIVELHLLALLRFERTLLRDVAVLLVNLDETGRFIEQRTGPLQLCLHIGEHLRNGGELNDRLAELGTLLRILERLAVSGLAKTHRLCTDTQTGSVHERHHVFDQTHLTVADQTGRSVGEDQLAGGRTLDTEFVLDTAHLDAAVTLVVHEHRKTACVRSSLFGAGQHQRNMTVAVGDEALHAVQQPTAALLVVSGLEHHGTQVRTCIRLGKVHRAGLARRNTGQEHPLKLFRSEFIERFGTVLQTPDILETGIAACHHFVGDDEADQREIQAVVLVRQGHAAQAGLGNGVDVAGRTLGVNDMVVLDSGTFVIDALGIGGDHLAAHFAGDLQHAAVVVHRVLKILRSKLVVVFQRIVTLFQRHDLAHQRMLKVELQILII